MGDVSVTNINTFGFIFFRLFRRNHETGFSSSLTELSLVTTRDKQSWTTYCAVSGYIDGHVQYFVVELKDNVFTIEHMYCTKTPCKYCLLYAGVSKMNMMDAIDAVLGKFDRGPTRYEHNEEIFNRITDIVGSSLDMEDCVSLRISMQTSCKTHRGMMEIVVSRGTNVWSSKRLKIISVRNLDTFFYLDKI